MNTLGVTGQSSTHVARILKEKSSFLPRHDKSSRPQRYSQGNTCVEVSLIKLQAWKKTPTQVFSCEYCEIVKNIYFEEHLGTATSWERVDRYLAETIKAKKQTITATTELANLAQVTVGFFELAPCTKQEWVVSINCSMNWCFEEIALHRINSLPSEYPVGIYLLKVNNRNSRTRCEICSKLTVKTSEQSQWRRCGVFMDNSEHILHLFLMFLLLTLNM